MPVLSPTLLSLYLVTDSSLLPPGRTLHDHVREAISAGCTIVQLREKTLPTDAFISLAREIHRITQAAHVPLLINDRVDVALAVDCEGVHIGWDDLDYTSARQMLGPNKIIGLSVSDTSQADKAAALQPDYLGLGPVFATPTKPDHSPPLGLTGLRDLLAYISTLSSWGEHVPTVAIGGVNLTNVQSVIGHSTTPTKHLSGVAVVSAIMASPQPSLVCHEFRRLSAAAAFISTFALIWERVPEAKPMIHHITNNVVKTFSANLTLAAGGSPIMSENFEEFAELAAVNGALVLNMGTAGADARRLFATAVQENNRAGNPVIFDPVGAGASALRRETVKAVLEAGYIDVIKGNESEIRTVAGESVVQRGVDSISTGNEGMNDKIALVKALAARLGNIVVMTGKTDIVSTGTQTYVLSNGHEYQGLVTGTGCSLGSVIAVAVAANKERKLTAVLAAITAYNIAAEVAAEAAGGPGSWAAGFVDAVWKITKGAIQGAAERARVQIISEYVVSGELG